MQIKPKPNKAETRQDLKHYILAHCDEDIALTFAPHGFLLEPLLLQLVREMHMLRLGEDESANYVRRIERAFQSLSQTASRNQPAGPTARDLGSADSSADRA